ncbi:MAG: hypothetical protein AB1374_04925 [Bacillota bacterium]
MRVGVVEAIFIFFTGIIPMVGFLILIVLAWRIMKAQEAIADAMREIARKIERGRQDSL